MASDQETKEGHQETRSFIRETKGLIQEAFKMSPKPMKASFKSYISDGTSSSSADLQSFDTIEASGDHSISTKSDHLFDEVSCRCCCDSFIQLIVIRMKNLQLWRMGVVCQT